MSVEDHLPVYLVHWMAPEWCASACRSILETENLRAELTVIDNGGACAEELRDLLPAAVRIIATIRNRGYAAGANLAVADFRNRFPDSEFMVLGSHDLHVGPATFVQLVSEARRTPSYGVLAPATVKRSGILATGGFWQCGRPTFVHVSDDAADPVERDWVSGTCLLLRRGCLNSVGAFDERIGSYVEDIDFCLRSKDTGWRVACLTSARSWGLGSRSKIAGARIEANIIVLLAKRQGFAGALRGYFGLSCRMLKTLASFIVPGMTRPPGSSMRSSLIGIARSVYPVLSSLSSRHESNTSLRRRPFCGALGSWKRLAGRYRAFASPSAILFYAFSRRVSRLLSYFGIDRFASLRITRPFKGRVLLRPDSSDSATFREIVEHGIYRHVVAHLEQADVIVDLGANIGLATLLFAHRYPGAKILAVEPNPRSLPILRMNLCELIRSERCKIVQAAIWSRDGVLVAPNSSAEHAMIFRVSDRALPGKATAEIPGMTITSLLRMAEISHVDLLKIDIEGAEVELLRGRCEWLRCVGALAIEFHGASRETTSFDSLMARWGFDIVEDKGHTTLAMKRRPTNQEVGG